MNNFNKCRVGLHESLATFPWSNFQGGLRVHVLFLSPKNEVLVLQSGTGELSLPYEEVKMGYVLLNSPFRVHQSALGGEQYCPFDFKSGRQTKMLCEYVEGEIFHVFMSAPVVEQKSKQWVFLGNEQISSLPEGLFVKLAAEALVFANISQSKLLKKEAVVA